jgi:hypothetical protein
MEELAGIAQFTGVTGGLSIVGTSADAQASDAVWYAWSSDFLGHPASNLFRRGLGHPPGRVALQRPAVARDGHLALFAVAGDGAVWHGWLVAVDASPPPREGLRAA